jgi:hypothetical protein
MRYVRSREFAYALLLVEPDLRGRLWLGCCVRYHVLGRLVSEGSVKGQRLNQLSDVHYYSIFVK